MELGSARKGSRNGSKAHAGFRPREPVLQPCIVQYPLEVREVEACDRPCHLLEDQRVGHLFHTSHLAYRRGGSESRQDVSWPQERPGGRRGVEESYWPTRLHAKLEAQLP